MTTPQPSRYRIFPSRQYERDIRRLTKSHVDLSKLEGIIDRLAAGELLPTQYRDHELKGRLRGTRACHISPDWLLHYVKGKGKLVLLLLRTGSHRDVLGIE